MYDWDYGNCAMDAVKFKKIREKCKDLLVKGWDVTLLIACIHDLWDEYLCSEEQEVELYNLVDPKELFNNVCDYYLQFQTNKQVSYLQTNCLRQNRRLRN